MRRICFLLLASVMIIGEIPAQDQGVGAPGGTSGRSYGNSRGSSGRSSGSSSRSGRSEGNFPTENEQNRNVERRQRSRERNSNLNRGGSSQSAAGQKTAQGQTGKPGESKTPTTIKGKTPAKSAASSGGGGASGGGPAVEFKMQPNPNVNILYLEGLAGMPTMNLQAVEGGTFSTRVALRNARHSKFQTLEFALKYSPDVLQPTGIDDTDIAGKLTGPASAGVDARKGILRYRAELAEPRSDDNFEIVKIQWKAVGPSSNSPVSFLNTPVMPSRVLTPDGANILQLRDEEGELEVSDRTGLLDASVSVAPGKRTTEAIEESADTLTALAMANSITAGTAEGGISLALRPRVSGVRVGDDFLVDVVFSNPRRAEMDMLKMTIRFDPRVLEVVDHDNNNWISRGINIFDGDYHEELPFDYHLRNIAYNAAGEIRYEMGFSNRTPVPAAGTVATIRFRAKASAPSTAIAFDLDETASTPATTASFLGFNLIGVPGQRTQSLLSAAVGVQ